MAHAVTSSDPHIEPPRRRRARRTPMAKASVSRPATRKFCELRAAEVAKLKRADGMPQAVVVGTGGAFHDVHQREQGARHDAACKQPLRHGTHAAMAIAASGCNANNKYAIACASQLTV